VRHELIPLLEKTYQPRLIAQMGSFANYAEGLEEHLQNYFEDLCSDIVREDDNYLIIDLLAFERLSTFWKKECLYRLLKEVKTVGQELTRVHVNEVMKVLESTNPYVQMQVLKNLWFTKAYAQGAIGRKPLLEDMRLSFSC
jgi:hypothetical protein